jgi:hypothetical protein
MSHTTGKIVAIAGAAVTLVATFLTWFGTDGASLTFWSLNKRWDVVSAIMCGAVIVLAVMTLSRAAFGASVLLIVFTGALCGNFLFYVVELGHGAKAGVYLAAIGSVVAVIGGIMTGASDLTLRAAGPASAFGAPDAQARIDPPTAGGLPYSP